jgi:hypothetical protein
MGREAAARVAARPPPELGLPAGLSVLTLESKDDSAEFWSALRGTRAAYLDLSSGESFRRIKATVQEFYSQFFSSLDMLVVMISIQPLIIILIWREMGG